MQKQEAIKLLKEAIDRIESPKVNADGGEWQAAGCYWRLAQVLSDFVAPEMIKHQSPKQYWDVLRAHGAIYPVEGQKHVPVGQRFKLEPMVVKDGKIVRASEVEGYQGISFSDSTLKH